VWSSVVDGQRLVFHLAAINNQNFVMQDESTGTWWQQVSGEAILGPLKGKRLAPVAFDQITFATWQREAPRGRVLMPDDRIAQAGRYARRDWEARMQNTPPPAGADRTLAPRALVIGLEIGPVSQAYPVAALRAAGIVLDEIGGVPIAIVRARDERSTRVFDRRVEGRTLELAVRVDREPLTLVDTTTGSEWDFTGAATSGPLAGRTLARVPFLEEYWFDWKTYHPRTTIARSSERALSPNP